MKEEIFINKQFDLFVKMKCKELSENISRMTYAYIQPDTNLPTVVPAKHYKDILDQPVEALIDDAVKEQFLIIMCKQIKNLKEEEPVLFNKALLLMDLNKTPESLEVNEKAALNILANELVDKEKKEKKKFHLLDKEYLDAFENTKEDSELMASLLKRDNQNIYKIDLTKKKGQER